MMFEPSQTSETLGPFFAENALSDVPIFGPDKANVGAIMDKAMQSGTPDYHWLVDETASEVPLPEAFAKATTIAEKLKALRWYIWRITYPDIIEKEDLRHISHPLVLLKLENAGPEDISTRSCRSLHEMLLKTTMDTAGFPNAAKAVLDHVMLLRAKEKYLLDCRVNRAVVDDDPWLKSVWAWIEGTGFLHVIVKLCLR